MTTVSKGRYENPLGEKHSAEGFVTPPPVPRGIIAVKHELDLRGDFNEFMDAWRKEQEENYRRRTLQWQNDVLRHFGCIPYYDGYDDEWDEYDEWGNYVGYVHGSSRQQDYRTHNQKMMDKYGNPQRKKSTGGIKPQKFINGIEVDPDITDEDAKKLFRQTARKPHNKRGGKKRRYEGGTTSRTFQDGYDDDWFGDTTLVIDPDNDVDPGYDCQTDRCKNTDELLDDVEAEKNIVFYRHLNNTADTYTFDNALELSEWLDENGIHVTDSDAYDIIYSDEVHCTLDPDTDVPTLTIAHNYEDLVYFLTGGDQERIAEISAISCPF